MVSSFALISQGGVLVAGISLLLSGCPHDPSRELCSRATLCVSGGHISGLWKCVSCFFPGWPIEEAAGYGGLGG